jgi:hypothetical protein
MEVYRKVLRQYFYPDLVNEILKHYQEMKFRTIWNKCMKAMNSLYYPNFPNPHHNPVYITSCVMQYIEQKRQYFPNHEKREKINLLFPRKFNFNTRLKSD